MFSVGFVRNLPFVFVKGMSGVLRCILIGGILYNKSLEQVLIYPCYITGKKQ